MHDDEPNLASVDTALQAIRSGGMIILVDDKDRENEGDVIVAAEHCTAEHVNFMCKHGRGLVCLALSSSRIEHLRIPMMVPTDPGNMGTAFTVSIEARHGVSTGISAADRAQTIRVAVDPRSTAEDLASPGHIFPLRAQPGGVLVRSGHTEGAVDLARLAGLTPAGVICEIMREDGEMARMDDLEEFARRHEMPILTIADLIAYRLARETLVEEIGQADLASAFLGLSSDQGWTIRTFRSRVGPLEHYMAICKGDVSNDTDAEPVLIRAQQAQVLGDVFGLGGPSGHRLRNALHQIDRAGRGLFLYVLGRDMTNDVARAMTHGQEPGPGLKAAESGFRQFGMGAQVLAVLGIRRIRVITNNPRKIIGLKGYGIEVVGTVPLEGETP